jgi:ATP-dependent exoDNAse (exonuclease V) beta subunit
VVHLALERLSLRASLPRRVEPVDRLCWRRALQGQGLWGDPLDQALAEVEQSVARTLASEQGRWMLSRGHGEARSEWALTCAGLDGSLRDLVIDRTFVDRETGARWIVDYKTSSPDSGENLEAFLAREADTYRPQLALYRDALAAMGPCAIRCALYFTRLDCFHPLPELDWSPGVS